MNPQSVQAIVMGSSPTGLYAVRELARAGFTVACVDVSRGCAMASRYLGRGKSLVGDLDAIAAWLDGLRDAPPPRPVLIPTSDLFIEFVIRQADRLAGFMLFDGYRSIASSLLDKADFHALCRQHGVATPGVWHARDVAELRNLQAEIPFPSILKPVLIHRVKEFLRGKKILLARSLEEYAAHVAAMPEDAGGWLVQEIIPGPESDITLFAGYFDHQGELREAFAARKLRQYPPGFGSASLVLSDSCEETKSLSARFLHGIGFKGVCGAEFKRDARDGKLKIIEINPRPTLWFQVSHDAGKRIVAAAARDMLGVPAVPETVQRDGVRWRYALKDAASARFYARNGGSFVFPPPDVSPAAHATARSWPVYSGRDPLPALQEPMGYVRKAWKRLR